MLRQSYNALDPAARPQRKDVLVQLLGAVGVGTVIEPPFFCDYGTQIILGAEVFINFNCVFLDCSTITIGQQTQLGPAVQLYTATHPLDPVARTSGAEFARPITIGSRVWVGGGSVILPGVTIGDDTVVGAGSVVTRSLPPGVVAVSNPCRVLRRIDRAHEESDARAG
ncbi:MAG: sugar O-acetyltransferase [Gemmatimonadaceae bacterium]|nr:sugar O-acetyltransferase [Gemmatimonadaceae bacterium]